MNKKNENNQNFGARIRVIRKQKGMTQVELAKILGVTPRGVSYYENESENPSIEQIGKLA